MLLKKTLHLQSTMQHTVITYLKYQFPKWFLTVILLFSFSGYSNYTHPKIKETTIELVVSSVKKFKKSITFSNVLKNKSGHTYLKNNPNYLVLSKYHSILNSIKITKRRYFVTILTKQLLKPHQNTSYNSEEDTFHFNLG